MAQWRKWSIGIAALAMVAGVTACGSSGSADNGGNSGAGNGSGSSSAGGSGTIDIGMLADLTGSAALSGKHKQMGAELAVDEINAHGGINGKQLKLIVEDDQGSNQAGVSAYQKLAANPNVVAVISSIKSTIVQATLPNVRQAQIPTMIGGTAPALTQTGNPWVFRFRPNDTYASEVMASYSTKSMGSKKVAILYSNDAFGTAGNSLLKANLDKDGAQVVADEGFTTGTKDYTSYLENIKSSGADTLETYIANSEDVAQMLKQFRQLGLNMKILGSSSLAQEVTFQLGGSAVNGAYAVTDFVGNGNAQAQAFSNAYQAKYNEPSDLYGAWVTDAINILAQVMKKDGTSPRAIQQGLRSIQRYNGIEGTYNFDKNGDGLHGYSIVEVANDKSRLIQYVNFGS